MTGNANVVRIPSKDFPQISIINKAVNMALEQYPACRPYICFVRYGREPVSYTHLDVYKRQEQRESILREIESGDIFETDRIALDPYFGKEMAGKRYANWSRDLLEQNGHVCVGYYKDTPAAFGVNIDKENAVCDAVLGGMLNHGGRAGLGFLSLFTNLYSARERGKMCIRDRYMGVQKVLEHLTN